MSPAFDEFRGSHERMKDRILAPGHPGFKGFFNLDSPACRDAVLDGGTMELPGLIPSAVLGSNAQSDYCPVQFAEAGWMQAELQEALNVALTVGGGMLILHMRHAVESRDMLHTEKSNL